MRPTFVILPSWSGIIVLAISLLLLYLLVRLSLFVARRGRRVWIGPPLSRAAAVAHRTCRNADCGCVNPMPARFCRRCGWSIGRPFGLADAG